MAPTKAAAPGENWFTASAKSARSKDTIKVGGKGIPFIRPHAPALAGRRSLDISTCVPISQAGQNGSNPVKGVSHHGCRGCLS
jgi:hypothetical protein